MLAYRVVSVNVAEPAMLLNWPTGDVISAIDKRPVTSPVAELRTSGLDGDRQADTRPTPGGGQVHGGPDQAVYAYPSEHFGRLAEILGQPIGPGFVGENVTLAGALEADVCIGDIWQWGSAVLQITAPRGPCYKLGIRIGRQAARTAVRSEGLVGWYLRVLTPGEVAVAGPITLVARHPAGATVASVHFALQDRGNAYPELAGLEVLSANLRRKLLQTGRDLSGGVPEDDSAS